MIELLMEEDAGTVIIWIRDQAKSFDASHVSGPRLDLPFRERPPGGMGIYLIKKMTDEAEFRPLPGGGNELRLTKRGVIKNQS